MFRVAATFLFLTAIIGIAACDTPRESPLSIPTNPTSVGSNNPSTSRVQPGSPAFVDIPTPTITSLSPTSARLGSDVMVTITGSGFLLRPSRPPAWGPFGPAWTFVAWHTGADEDDADDAYVDAHVISETQLTAVLPASLLATSAATSAIRVVNGDGMGWSDGFRGYPHSGSMSFEVTRAR